MRTAGSQASAQVSRDRRGMASRLGPAIPADIASRYEGARSIILAPPPIEKSKSPSSKPDAAPVVVETPVPTASAESLVSQNRFDAAVAAIAEKRSAIVKRATKKTRASRRDSAVTAAAWKPATARKPQTMHARNRCACRRRSEKFPHALEHDARAGSRPRSRTAALAGMVEQRTAQGDLRRDRNVAARDHPDALATRLRELREEWQRLSGASNAPQALEQRFQIAVRIALLQQRASVFRQARRSAPRARRRSEARIATRGCGGLKASMRKRCSRCASS